MHIQIYANLDSTEVFNWSNGLIQFIDCIEFLERWYSLKKFVVWSSMRGHSALAVCLNFNTRISNYWNQNLRELLATHKKRKRIDRSDLINGIANSWLAYRMNFTRSDELQLNFNELRWTSMKSKGITFCNSFAMPSQLSTLRLRPRPFEHFRYVAILCGNSVCWFCAVIPLTSRTSRRSSLMSFVYPLEQGQKVLYFAPK